MQDGRRPDVVVRPGPQAVAALHEALALAAPGQHIRIAAGRYVLEAGLVLAADGVRLQGEGMERTVLDFSRQDSGGEGLLVTGDRVTVEDLAIEAAPGDALKVRDARGVTLRRVRALWPGEPRAENGAYGLYPVGCSDVLVEGCHARGASDAGIYVGQSRRVIVRDCRVEGNVAGIEIENSRHVDVHDNLATGNTGGILVFDLPDLPVGDGGEVRVFRNRVLDNRRPNFAPEGNIVRLVPRGTGLLVMANDEVELFENEVRGHPTANLLVLSYLATGRPLEDAGYDPFPRAVHVHDNRFGDCGDDPDGLLGSLAAATGGLPLPDVIWDGARPPHGARGTPLSLHDNGEAGFLDMDLLTLQREPAAARPSRDPTPHATALEPLAPVRLGSAAR